MKLVNLRDRQEASEIISSRYNLVTRSLSSYTLDRLIRLRLDPLTLTLWGDIIL